MDVSAGEMRGSELARLILGSLGGARRVVVDGLGVFSVGSDGRINLRQTNRPRVFIAYAVEDAEWAEFLFDELKRRGYSPWLDRRMLAPGQNWPRRIEEAIYSADFFLACFSTRSVRKRGGFQAEIRYALDCARRLPLDEVFFVPVRLDECRVPASIQRETQYVDLFPDRIAGVERIAGMMEKYRREAA